MWGGGLYYSLDNYSVCSRVDFSYLRNIRVRIDELRLIIWPSFHVFGNVQYEQTREIFCL
jgi:hypothetical protein